VTTATRCPRYADPPRLPHDGGSYAYLLGLYLGDGHLATTPRLPQLGITCSSDWPGLIEACGEAMIAVLANRYQKVARRPHDYPRYMFCNKSEGIMEICRSMLARLDVQWTMCRPDSLSVARRECVEVLDRWIGPKF
jgi:hypothetical protein